MEAHNRKVMHRQSTTWNKGPSFFSKFIAGTIVLQGFHTLQGTAGFSQLLPSIKKVTMDKTFMSQQWPRRRKVSIPYDTPHHHHHHTSSNLRMTNEKSLFEPGSGPTVVIDPDATSSEIYSRAIGRTLQWMAATAVFGAILWILCGHDTSYEFFAGYLVEQSLSVDNLFVFLLLFDYFRVPLAAQDRVLNWGIYGAIIMRAVMIGLGSVALAKFHAVLLLFAGILVYSSISALFTLDKNGEEEEEEEDMSENSIVKFSRNLIDSTDYFDGDRFFAMVDGVKKATPLFICMIALEISDVVFAVDSIPAVFGVTSVRCSFNCTVNGVMCLSSLTHNMHIIEPTCSFLLQHVCYHGPTKSLYRFI